MTTLQPHSLNAQTIERLGDIGAVYPWADDRLAACPDAGILLHEGVVVPAISPVELKVATSLGKRVDEIVNRATVRAEMSDSDFWPATLEHARVEISQLRQKIGALGSRSLVTFHGQGYGVLGSLAPGYMPETRPDDKYYELPDGSIKMNVTRGATVANGVRLQGLSPSESLLLQHLLSHAGEVQTYDELGTGITGESHPIQRANTHELVGRLRRHLGPNLRDAIVMIHGTGYLLKVSLSATENHNFSTAPRFF